MAETSKVKEILLEGTGDRYGGVRVETLPAEIDSAETFEKVLKASIRHWKEKGKRGIWLKLTTQQASFIPAALSNGFVYHHTQPTYLMLTNWLTAETETNKIPEYATHHIGVGGFVLNEKKELLVVRERYFSPPHRWKLPGGLTEPGEDLGLAAQREVFEETGVKTEAVSLICFRHLHGASFGRGDIYFAVRLKPLTSEINIDPAEILECRWLPISEYLNDPMVFQANKEIAKQALLNMQPDGTIIGEYSPKPIPNPIFETQVNLFYSHSSPAPTRSGSSSSL